MRQFPNWVKSVHNMVQELVCSRWSLCVRQGLLVTLVRTGAIQVSQLYDLPCARLAPKGWNPPLARRRLYVAMLWDTEFLILVK